MAAGNLAAGVIPASAYLRARAGAVSWTPPTQRTPPPLKAFPREGGACLGLQTDQYVDTALARFRYTATGAGPPVLLLPGAGGWRLSFHAMVPVLAERHMVVALDPPGQGRTRVLDPEFGYDADAIARSMADFLDVLGWSARRSWAFLGRRVRAAVRRALSGPSDPGSRSWRRAA
jgi:hypothetical protein